MVVVGVGGLYPNAEIVRAVLAPQEGIQKKILDLGRLSFSVLDPADASRLRNGCMV
jgi:hypothetical protein